MTETSARRPWWAEPARWVWPALIGSLALNLAVAGSMLGQRLRPQSHLPPGIAARLAQDSVTPLVRDLSPERRAQLRAIFEASRGQNRDLWIAVRERRAEVTKSLEIEPFDKAVYVSAITRLIETEAKARAAAQSTFADVAAALSVKERQDFLANHRQLRQQILGPGRDGPGRENGARRERPVDGTPPPR